MSHVATHYAAGYLPCLYCGDKAVHVDHIHPRCDGSVYEAWNLAPTCKGYNSSKGTRSVEAFLRYHPEILARVRAYQAGQDVLTSLLPGDKPQSIEDRVGQTLRLYPEAWKQLKIIAADEDTTSHDLLIGAVNDFFTKKGKPPIA